MNINELANTVHKLVVKNSSTILVGFGIASFVATIGFVIKSAPRASYIVEKFNDDIESYSELTQFEYNKVRLGYYVKNLGPIYAPAIVSGILSIGCFIGSNHINIKRKEMLVAAYSLSEKALTTYQQKVVEEVGYKKHLVVEDAIAKDKLDSTPFVPESVIVTTFGDTRCYDAWSGRYFLSDVNAIRKAENEMVKRLRDGDVCTVNDFYAELGLSNAKFGDIVGWDPNDILIDVKYSSILDETDTPCLVLDFYVGVLESRYNVL